jgi:hypothetical protein
MYRSGAVRGATLSCTMSTRTDCGDGTTVDRRRWATALLAGGALSLFHCGRS